MLAVERASMIRKFAAAGCALLIMHCKRQDEPGSGPYMIAQDELRVNATYQDPTLRDPAKPDPAGMRVRTKSLELLHEIGFKPAESLPTAGHRAGVSGSPRPASQVAKRLLALAAAIEWVLKPEEKLPSATIEAFVSKGDLRSQLTLEERGMLVLSREDALKRHGDTIGWRMENVWPLAWALGFTQPTSPAYDQVGREVMQAIMRDFLPSFESDPRAWVEQAKLRPTAELIELEDLFFCAHNAVRSAQLGDASKVPKAFHPVLHGGAVHERRHALTWILSPGVVWENTDLST